MALERIIIGFDTSLRSTGIGVVQVMGSARKALHYAPVRIPQTRPMSQALQLLDAEVTRILDTFHPTEAALETESETEPIIFSTASPPVVIAWLAISSVLIPKKFKKDFKPSGTLPDKLSVVISPRPISVRQLCIISDTFP